MRRRSDGDDLRSSRRSYTYYPVDSPELASRMQLAYQFEGYFTYLLHQDLQHVIPYTIGRHAGEQARVVGPDAEAALPLVAAALSDRRYPSLQDGVRDFVNQTAQMLVLGGPTTYELVFTYAANAPEDANPNGFRLELITPGTLAERRGVPIQYVLPSLSELRDRNGLAYVVLDAATLVRFTLPADLEKPVRKFVQFLRTANLQQAKEFSLMERSMTQRTGYEFTAHKQARGELFARVTRPIGWNVRDLYPDDQLEPLQLWRQIRFLEFKVRVRDAILATLNDAIGQAGRVFGFQASIEVAGLPGLDDVETAKADLKAGERGVGELATWAI